MNELVSRVSRVFQLLTFLLVMLCFCPLTLRAELSSPLQLEDSQAIYNLASKTEFLEDPSRQLSLEQVSSPAWDDQFAVKGTANFGRSRSAFWIRFQVVDASQQKWYLLLEAMLEDEFDLYIFPVGKVEQASKTMTERYATKLSDYRRRAWSLDFPKQEYLQVYIRVTNGDSVVAVPIEFLNADAMLARSNGAYKISSAIYAGMIILALYQLFMFLILRERNYLFLMLSMLAMAVIIHRTNPVFSGLNILRGTGTYFFATPILIAVFSTAAFAREMLDAKKNSPWVDLIFKLFIRVSLGLVFVTGLLPAGPMYALILGLLIILFTQFSGFYIAYFRNGGIIAKYFAWIYLIPFLLHIPNLIMLLFKVELWQAQRDLLPAFGTLLLMLLLALLQAKRVSLLRDDMLRTVTANEAKDEFIAVMNHELRTPMNVVVGLGNLLKLENLTDIQKNYANRLNDASRHMMHLIDNILDHFKVGQREFNLKSEAFRLDIALQSVYRLLAQQANQKGLKLILDDRTEEMLIIKGDRSRLEQVLINLLNNAIKYTPDGQVSLCVTQQTGSSSETVRLHFSVCDTGPGIPFDQQEKLFEPFVQLATRKTSQGEGVGLGLPISKKLVEHMGGCLQVNSQPDSGSEFFFEVEMSRGSVADRAANWSNVTELTQLRLPAGVRILLVDDSEPNRFVATEMLQNMGAEVSQANSGKSTILQLQQYSYDLVLLDISMSDMDGLEVARRIREDLQLKLPVIALTAHVSADMEQQCLAAGMDGFIGKPFEYPELYSIINRQLGKAI